MKKIPKPLIIFVMALFIGIVAFIWLTTKNNSTNSQLVKQNLEKSVNAKNEIDYKKYIVDAVQDNQKQKKLIGQFSKEKIDEWVQVLIKQKLVHTTNINKDVLIHEIYLELLHNIVALNGQTITNDAKLLPLSKLENLLITACNQTNYKACNLTNIDVAIDKYLAEAEALTSF